MTIGGITGGNSSYVPSSAVDDKGDTAKLEQQKKYLQSEIERVKKDENIKPESKNKKIEDIKKRLKEIEEQIQRISQKNNDNSEISKSSTQKKNIQHDKGMESLFLLNKLDNEKSQSMHNSFNKTRGHILDLYV